MFTAVAAAFVLGQFENGVVTNGSNVDTNRLAGWNGKIVDLSKKFKLIHANTKYYAIVFAIFKYLKNFRTRSRAVLAELHFGVLI